jgi:hypothetical protein
MITINKSAANDVYVTLKENQTITSPYYLFKFTNEATKEIKYCYLVDDSAYTDRYNHFTLTEGTNVTLNGDGFYRYEIYESNDQVASTAGKNRLEDGIVRVVGTITNTWVEHTHNDTFVE